MILKSIPNLRPRLTKEIEAVRSEDNAFLVDELIKKTSEKVNF